MSKKLKLKCGDCYDYYCCKSDLKLRGKYLPKNKKACENFNICWEYTRTNRTHYFDDGEVYGLTTAGNCHWRLWEISSSAPYGFVQGEYGYDLYHKSKFIRHGKTVKELKRCVVEQSQETKKYAKR